MDNRDQLRKLSEDLIMSDIKNAKRYKALKSSTSLGSSGLHWIPLGLFIGMNLFAFILSRQFMRLFPDNLILIIIVLIAEFYNFKEKYENYKDKKEIQHMEEQHKSCIIALNKFREEHPEMNIVPWWNCFNGLDEMNLVENGTGILTWVPFERIYMHEKTGVACVAQPFTGNKPISGSDVLRIMKNQNYRIIYNIGIDPEEEYTIAEFAMHQVMDGTYTYSEKKSENSIRRELDEYSNSLDTNERYSNMFMGEFPVTNRERYIAGTMSSHEYQDSLNQRNLALEGKSRKLQNATVTVTTDVGTLDYVYEPVGIAIIDKNNNFAVMLIQKEARVKEFYHVDSYKRIIRTFEGKIVNKQFDSGYVFRHFGLYNLGQIDLAQDKPEAFSDLEWAEWLYAHYYYPYHYGNKNNTTNQQQR